MFIDKNNSNFADLIKKLNIIYNLKAEIPDLVFKNQYKYYVFTTYEDLFYPELYEAIKNIIFEKKIYFCDLYNLDEFIFEFDFKKENVDDILHQLHKRLFNDYYVNVVSSRCAIFNYSNNFAIYGERDFDTCIIGLNDFEYKMKLLKEDRFFNLLEIINLMSGEFPTGILPNQFEEEFLRNYNNQS